MSVPLVADMRAHVLLNLLNELGKRVKFEACRSLSQRVINAIIQEHEC